MAINFGQANQQWLDRLSLSDTDRFIAEGHFAKGSMLPKVEAAAAFAPLPAGAPGLNYHAEQGPGRDRRQNGNPDRRLARTPRGSREGFASCGLQRFLSLTILIYAHHQAAGSPVF
ncbi:Carbamate kinase 1 [Raoultella terrigena]|uniref:Carbamate kinase 1 n=1 Tax=Raoultella terrigena TaxID=577 RepID=A0A3P8M344_RAOTE|nr:Carbamate kinase 1 [Raoultella terrigena]